MSRKCPARRAARLARRQARGYRLGNDGRPVQDAAYRQHTARRLRDNRLRDAALLQPRPLR